LHEDRDFHFQEKGADDSRGRREHLLTLTIAVLAEPRFIVLSTEPANVEVARDENQVAFHAPRAVEKPRNVLYLPLFGRDFQHPAELFLRRASRKSATISTLRGTVPVLMVADRRPTVAIRNLSKAKKGTKIKVGDDALELTDATANDNGFHIGLSVPPEKKAGVHIDWHKRVHVEDADGRRLTPNGTSTSSHSGSNCSYAEIGLSFPKAMIGKGEGARLVIEDWLITRHSVPFAWQDMPLP
jgi:hypothetical protein